MSHDGIIGGYVSRDDVPLPRPYKRPAYRLDTQSAPSLLRRVVPPVHPSARTPVWEVRLDPICYRVLVGNPP